MFRTRDLRIDEVPQVRDEGQNDPERQSALKRHAKRIRKGLKNAEND